MKSNWLITGLLCIGGCSTSKNETVTQMPNHPAGQATIISVPVSTPTPEPPEWASLFNKAVACVGQSKAIVVDKLGEPLNVEHGFSNNNRTLYRYRAASDGEMYPLLSVYMDEVGSKIKVKYIVFRFYSSHPHSGEKNGTRINTEHVWKYLFPKANVNKVIYNENEIYSFYNNEQMWDRELGNNPVASSIYRIGLLKKSKDLDYFLVAATDTPPLFGESKFNPETDQKETSKLADNPDFNWKNSKLECIYVGDFNYYDDDELRDNGFCESWKTTECPYHTKTLK